MYSNSNFHNKIKTSIPTSTFTNQFILKLNINSTFHNKIKTSIPTAINQFILELNINFTSHKSIYIRIKQKYKLIL